MKKAARIGIGALVLLFVGSIVFSSLIRQKIGGITSVGRTLIDADSNYISVVEFSPFVVRARHNIPLITRAADYSVAVGANTQVFLTIARIASEADCECERLDSVLDLAVVKRSETNRILGLAMSACGLETPEQIEAWQKAYNEVLETAEYSSVEEALAEASDG